MNKSFFAKSMVCILSAIKALLIMIVMAIVMLSTGGIIVLGLSEIFPESVSFTITGALCVGIIFWLVFFLFID